MESPIALSLQQVSKTLATKKILCQLQLSIPKGTTHVLLGPSGAGKSTLVRIILGLMVPDEGSLMLNGQTPADFQPGQWNQSIGYVPQEGGLFPHLTARQNIFLVASTLGWSKLKMESRLAELNRLASLEVSLFDRYPKELSGGQRQRVALLRATFLDPELLILDEPLGALDPMIRLGVQTELKTIFQSLNKTVLLITHDLAEARFFADRLSLLKDGQILQSGVYADFLERPATPFVTQFFQAQRGGNA
jgi:osmoprotectant transport system ATP-binding protein